MRRGRRNPEPSLDEIKRLAKIRHEKARRAARRRGRKDFPMLPYECSWAFEEEFRRKHAHNPMIAGKSINWMWVIMAAGGMWWWWRTYGVPWRKLPASVQVQYAMQPVQAEQGKLASLQTYRLIENRRSNMTYTPVTSEENESVVFTMPKSGTITRNVLVESGKKYVEIA